MHPFRYLLPNYLSQGQNYEKPQLLYVCFFFYDSKSPVLEQKVILCHITTQ